MLLGIDGHLFSEAYLEQHLTGRLVDDDVGHRALTSWRSHCVTLGPASALRTLVEHAATPLVHALNFGVEAIRGTGDWAAATLVGATPPVALVVCPWGARLSSYGRVATVETRARGASWCLLFNGTHLRLCDTRQVQSPRYLEFDLDIALDDEPTRAVMWHLLNAAAFAIAADGNRLPLSALLKASDQHAASVSRSLKNGVLQASETVLQALMVRRPSPKPGDAFEQALTIVYRVLFLLFAEARGLAPLWHSVYRESYSLSALRTAAESNPPAFGLWDALRAISHLAHAGCRAGNLRVTAFNGRLFAPARTPLAERRDLDDESARCALLALSTRPTPDQAGRERIEYRDLGVEQLGAVYETLLDYQPVVAAPRTKPTGGPTVSLQNSAQLRKRTGTFYTPQPIAHYLVRRTLQPLVNDHTPEEILALKVLDPSMGSGAFLVAASDYLAQGYEAALVQSGRCHPTDLGPADRAAIRRTVAERCLYGVDLNPMAVQLARLSLWLATLAADKPLNFLDHHLAIGDSLLGTWLSCLTRPPADRRRTSPTRDVPRLFEDEPMASALRDVMPVRFSLADAADDTADRVREKERALAAINRRTTALSRWKRVADLWCARWFTQELPPSAFRTLADFILTGQAALPLAAAARCVDEVEQIATARRFFHWELEFPEVFFGADGSHLAAPGFDAIVGNPPWEMMRNDPGGTPHATLEDLSGVLRFTRDSGVYTAQSSGHANRYQLFVERAISLARPGGRIGLVVPSGLAMDHGSAALRRLLFSQCDVDSLVGFENRQQIFPIHRSVRFHLITATRGRATQAIACRLGETDPAVLDAVTDNDLGEGDWFAMRLAPAILRHLSGDGMDVPDLRTPIDLAIAERAAALFPALADRSGWGAQFGRELNATEDAAAFRDGGAGLPVVEGKAIDCFRINRETLRRRISQRDAERLLGTRHRRARLAYRDVASATNRMTLIAAILPAGCVSTHTVLCLRTSLSLAEQRILCGLFNSFVVNYLVRLRVTTHVTTAIVQRLPLPTRTSAPAALHHIAAAATLLTHRRDWSGDCLDALAQLNANVARLYQLSVGELQHVLDTFPLVPQGQRLAVMREFQRGA